MLLSFLLFDNINKNPHKNIGCLTSVRLQRLQDRSTNPTINVHEVSLINYSDTLSLREITDELF